MVRPTLLMSQRGKGKTRTLVQLLIEQPVNRVLVVRNNIVKDAILQDLLKRYPEYPHDKYRLFTYTELISGRLAKGLKFSEVMIDDVDVFLEWCIAHNASQAHLGAFTMTSTTYNPNAPGGRDGVDIKMF